jgi:hypothetical protein
MDEATAREVMRRYGEAWQQLEEPVRQFNDAMLVWSASWVPVAQAFVAAVGPYVLSRGAGPTIIYEPDTAARRSRKRRSLRR